MSNGVTGKMILDSVSEEGIRLTTLHLRYPRMIHSEVMTHRAFSRNGRSSRAVPVMTLLKEDAYTPHFMKNRPGMVATEELSPEALEKANAVWKRMVDACKEGAKELHELEVHKQWSNRPLEWFGYIDVLITSTDWANFFALRDECGAQPEIESVALKIKELLEQSKPQILPHGEWHMPYIQHEDWNMTAELATYSERVELLKKISTARCARLSIKPFDGDGSIEKELARFKRLVESRPVHASPAEHIATPDILETWHTPPIWQNKKEHGNFYGWIQFRKTLPYNTINDR